MGSLCCKQSNSTHQYSAPTCLESSPSSSLPTPWWPSTSPRRDGTKSRTTTASPLTPSTPPTWTSRRSRETLRPACPSTPPVSVLVATLTDSACPPESPSSRELTLRL